MSSNRDVYKWWHDAECAGTPTEMWFPGRGDRSWLRALEICLTCPVRRECLEEALTYSEMDDLGIRGGTTQRGRRRIRRYRATTPESEQMPVHEQIAEFVPLRAGRQGPKSREHAAEYGRRWAEGLS